MHQLISVWDVYVTVQDHSLHDKAMHFHLVECILLSNDPAGSDRFKGERNETLKAMQNTTQQGHIAQGVFIMHKERKAHIW